MQRITAQLDALMIKMEKKALVGEEKSDGIHDGNDA